MCVRLKRGWGWGLFVRFFFFCISSARDARFILTPDYAAVYENTTKQNPALFIFLHPSSLSTEVFLVCLVCLVSSSSNKTNARFLFPFRIKYKPRPKCKCQISMHTCAYASYAHACICINICKQFAAALITIPQ